MERKSRLPMFGSSRHKTRSEQRPRTVSHPPGQHNPSHFENELPYASFCMEASEVAQTTYESKSKSHDVSIVYHPTSHFLPQNNPATWDDISTGRIASGAAAMPQPAIQHKQPHAGPGKRGKLGLAVDAVRGVLGVNTMSELKHSERTIPRTLQSGKRGPLQRREPPPSSLTPQKGLYCEFTTSHQSPNSPPPLPSPCDILSSLPQPAKRPMKMPMSTFKSNNEPGNVRSTGGECRSHIESNLLWTKNPVNDVYFGTHVPRSPSPLYMEYDNTGTSPEHTYDTIPDEDSCSSVDGMREHCTSPTLGRHLSLSPTLSSQQQRYTSRPSCGIRMAEMRALATKRLQSPPHENEVMEHEPAISTESSIIPCHYKLPATRKEDKTRSSSRDLIEKKHVSSNVTRSRKSSPRNSAYTESSPRHSTAMNTYVKSKAQIRTKEQSRSASPKTSKVTQSKNPTNTKRNIKSKSAIHKDSTATQTAISQIKQSKSYPVSAPNIPKIEPKPNKVVSQRKLRVPSKSSQCISGQAKSKDSNKTRSIHAEKMEEDRRSLKEARRQIEYKPKVILSPKTTKSRLPLHEPKNIDCTPDKDTESGESATSMKDSLMSMSFSSCSPQSSDSESCASSINGLMDSSIESSDFERSIMQATGGVLPNLASFDIYDVDVTDSLTTDNFYPLPSKLALPSQHSAKQTVEAKSKTSKIDNEKTKSRLQSPSSSTRNMKQPLKYQNPTGAKAKTMYSKSPETKNASSKLKSSKRDIGKQEKKTSSSNTNADSERKKQTTSESRLRSPSKVKVRSIEGSDNNISPQQTTPNHVKPRVSRLAVSTTRTTTERSRIQRLSLQPKKNTPSPNVKPRHHSDSTDCYQRTQSNTSSTSTTPSSVTGSPLSSESCSSPLSPFSSNSDGHGGQGGGAGASSSRPSERGSRYSSNISRANSSNDTQHSNSKQTGGTTRSVSKPATETHKVAKFLSRLDEIDAKTSKKPTSNLRRPSSYTVNSKTSIDTSIKRSFSGGDAPDHLSQLRQPSRIRPTFAKQRSMDSNIKIGKNVCIYKTEQPCPINVHNDNTGRESDIETSQGNLCGAGTHIPSPERKTKISKISMLKIPQSLGSSRLNTNTNQELTPRIKSSLEHPQICIPKKRTLSLSPQTDDSETKNMDVKQISENIMTDDIVIPPVIESEQINETNKSIEDDLQCDLTEEGTYKIEDNGSTDDECDELQDETIEMQENKKSIVGTEHIDIILQSSKQSSNKRHAMYDSLEDFTEEELDNLDSVSEELKSLTLSDSMKCDKSAIGESDSYEQLCESSLEAISSSLKSSDFFIDTELSINETIPASKDYSQSGSISDGGETLSARFRPSLGSPTLQKRFNDKRMEEYVTVFMDQQCSLKRSEATSSLNMDGATLDDKTVSSTSMLKDTAVSESSLHTVIDTALEQQQQQHLQELADSMVLAYPNLKDYHLLTDDADSSEAESFVCNFNMNSSSNNLALCQEDLSVSNNSLVFQSDGEDLTSKSEDMHVCLSTLPETTDDADTETLKQSDSTLTICECRSECRSDSSGFTSLKDDASIISEDRISTSSSNFSGHSMFTSGSSSSSLGRSLQPSRLRAPRAGRNIKPVRRLSSPRESREGSLQTHLPPVEEIGGVALSKGDEGYFTMQGQVDKQNKAM